MELFDHVIAVYPSSTRAFFGKARAYDIRGEIEANERDRDKAIEIYEKILQNNAVPEALFRFRNHRGGIKSEHCVILPDKQHNV